MGKHSRPDTATDQHATTRDSTTSTAPSPDSDPAASPGRGRHAADD